MKILRAAIILAALVLVGCQSPPNPPEPRSGAPAEAGAVAARHQPARARRVVASRRVPLPRPRPAAKVEIVVLPPEPPPPPTAIAPPKVSRPPVPPGAVTYAPVLVQKQRSIWPAAPEPFTLGGLVEQESCRWPKDPKCWNPRAELKTSREYGFGFGQITVAYHKDGSERFNKFDELRKQYAALSAWRWEDRYDPGYQLTAVVEMVHGLWGRVPPSANVETQWAFTLSSYNGGLGSLLQDRRFCANSAGCDVTRWFGNIETHSLKSKAPQQAYGGQSWYGINRGYVRNVLHVRREKYRQFWEGA